jgi:hypothetical protein
MATSGSGSRLDVVPLHPQASQPRERDAGDILQQPHSFIVVWLIITSTYVEVDDFPLGCLLELPDYLQVVLLIPLPVACITNAAPKETVPNSYSSGIPSMTNFVFSYLYYFPSKTRCFNFNLQSFRTLEIPC